MIAAGTRSLYSHAKDHPKRTVIAVFVAMMQARSETPEMEVQRQPNEHRHRQ
jgi:hypothetical protein